MVTRRDFFGVLGGAFVRLQGGDEQVPTATLSGDLITDALRLAETEGDGRPSPDSSVGIFPARTNALPNGGFEVDTRYWSGAFNTVTRQTSNVLFGTHGARATITSSGQTAYVQVQGVPPATPLPNRYLSFKASVWPSTGAIGATLTAYMFESGGAVGGNVLGGITQAITLVAGRNEIQVTARPTQTDRTLIYARLQIVNLTAGDSLDIDGAALWDAALPYPYVEASEAVVEYLPASNLVTNPDFEASITGWSGGSTTRTQSTDQAKNGTHSLKAVSTAAGQVFVQGQYLATPVPQVAYGCGAWVYAPAAIVGKIASLNLNESGGSTGAQLVGGSGARSLESGWNYLQCAGTPAQTDRTSLIPIIFLNGAIVGDTYYVDKVNLGANYVAPTPTTVSRRAGTVTIPASGLSPRQGHVAVMIRLPWDMTSGSGHFRPTMPMTILFITGTASSESLTITFDGGLVIMTRHTAAGSDIAMAPWAPTKGTFSLIAAQWDETGVYVSVEGRPFVGPFQTFVADSFTRADTVSGLGTTELGGKPWQTAGTSIPKISSNRYTPHASNNGNGYAYLDLGEVPARWGGIVSYIDGGGGGSGTHTIACADAVGSLDDLLHLFLNETGSNYQWRDNSGAFNNYVGITTVSTIPDDGTPASSMATMQGDTLAITQGGESYSFRHESIARLASRYVFWEVGRANGASGKSSRWDSIQVDRYGNWSGPSSHIPTGFGDAIIGSNGDGTGYVCGDVLWVTMGRGLLSANDIAILNAVTTDPVPGDVSDDAGRTLIWPANTSQLWTRPLSPTANSARRVGPLASPARRDLITGVPIRRAADGD